MKTHQAWMLVLVNVLTIAIGQTMLVHNAEAQTGPLPVANANYASFSAGRPVVQQASFGACGACDGQGCGICGVTPVAGGFRLSNLQHAGAKRARKCSTGCVDSGGGILGGIGSCGPAGCGPDAGACGPQGCGLGGGALAGLGALNQSRYGGYGSMAMGTQNGPFGGGGCCTPIWHDFSVGYINLQRDYSPANTALTTIGPFPGGNILDSALNLNDVDADNSNGFTASYAMLIGPSTNLELNYMGVFSDDEAQVNGSPAGLYSVFGGFGEVRNVNGVNVNGFPQSVDDATLHRIAIDSELHSLELNCRRRWVSAGCLLHGSYLAGVRYVSLKEDFLFRGEVADGGFLNYDIEAENEAVGFQLGGDLFVCVSPRFKLGIEFEGGIYGNDSSVNERIDTFEVDGTDTTSATPVNGNDDNMDVAFIGEASAVALFKITPRLTLRGGYTLMYLDNFALAQDHFNPDSPFVSNARSPIVLNNKEEVLYDGAHVGITWMW